MNIKEITAAFKAKRRGISFAFLAERTETSADSPYRIKPAETVRPDETLVCVIGGSGGKGDHIRAYNGYLKQTDTFVKNVPELKGNRFASVWPFAISAIFIMTGLPAAVCITARWGSLPTKLLPDCRRRKKRRL